MSLTVSPRERTKNVYTQNGKPIVAKIGHYNGDYLPTTVAELLDLLGGLDKSIHSGDEVIIKPNLNCSYEMPLSTNLTFLTSVIEILQDFGAKVTIGEMSGKADGPTHEVIERLKLLPILKRYNVPFINFEEDEWLLMEVPGRYFKSYHVPRSIYEADKRVYLANMRCHSSARFSASMKLGVGWINMEDRGVLHKEKELTESKVAETNLGWQPNIALIDGRRSTVTRYGRGKYVYPNILMASGDMVALDTEAVKTLQTFPEDNQIQIPVTEIPQLTTALEHQLGSMDYTILEDAGHLETDQKSKF